METAKRIRKRPQKAYAGSWLRMVNTVGPTGKINKKEKKMAFIYTLP